MPGVNSKYEGGRKYLPKWKTTFPWLTKGIGFFSDFNNLNYVTTFTADEATGQGKCKFCVKLLRNDVTTLARHEGGKEHKSSVGAMASSNINCHIQTAGKDSLKKAEILMSAHVAVHSSLNSVHQVFNDNKECPRLLNQGRTQESNAGEKV